MNLDFQLLFEESPDILLVLLPDPPRYTMVAATRTRLAVTHSTKEQTLGRGLFEVFPDNPDDVGATGTSNLRASLDRVLETRAPDTMAVQKYDIRGPDGTFEARYWSPKNLPVLDPNGNVLFVLHRVEDVTELVRASELGDELRDKHRAVERDVIQRSRELSAANVQLREANAKLGELDAAKTAFFSNVSHEFRTPLTLMLGPLEDVLGDTASPISAQHRTPLSLAHANTLRLLRLVNALLDFSRLEAGRMSAHFAPLDLAQLTAELAGMFQSALEKIGVRLVIDCPPLSEPVWVDRDLWEKVVPNLVSNAAKFTLKGQITVRVREETRRVLLEVEDTGIGIPEAELPRIFDRFHRVAETTGRVHEGTGIGLSLVREVIQLHGGMVTVESQLGRGTTFQVAIPKGHGHLPADAVSQEPFDPRTVRDAVAHADELARLASGAPPTTTDDTSTLEIAEEGERGHVLVVDDNADLRAYITDLLTPRYDVSVAVDGMEALEAIRARTPDIVVSDVMMPRLDGFGLVRALRAAPATAAIPVILLSARAGEESTVDGLDAGADDYLVKPFSARELRARVRTHVELARTRHAWIEELERANRELDAFSYSVSHDLRAPLRAIDGFSVALAEDCSAALDSEGQRYLERIREGVARMTTLIDDMLNLARITRSTMSTELVDVSAIAAKVVADLRHANPTRSVTVDIATGLIARADGNLLGIVFVNLLGNAWKFTARAEAPRIEVGRIAGPDPTFFVRDNGVGFDPTYAARLFTPFHRLHSTADFEGTGIGLATVKRVISRHGGRVWAESALGRGATFHFSLPMRSTTLVPSTAPRETTLQRE